MLPAEIDATFKKLGKLNKELKAKASNSRKNNVAGLDRLEKKVLTQKILPRSQG